MSFHPDLLVAAFDAVARNLDDGASRLPDLRITAQCPPQTETLLRAAARQAGLVVRRVRLHRSEWWKDAAGPIIGFARTSKKPVVLLPAAHSSYVLHDPETGHRQLLTAEQARELDEDAFMFYRSLPKSVRSSMGLIQFGLGLIKHARILTVVTGVMGGLLQLAFPIAAIMIFSLSMNIAVALALTSIAAAALWWSGSILAIRMNGRLALALEAALWQRILQLPVTFIRSLGPRDLGARAASLRDLSDKLANEGPELLRHAVGLAASLGLIAWLDPALGIAASAFLALVVAGRIYRRRRQSILADDLFRTEVRNQQFLHGVVSDLTQLRLAAADSRAISVWERGFASQCKMAARLRRYRNIDLALDAGLLPAGWFVLLVLHYAGFIRIHSAEVPALIIAFAQSLSSCWMVSERWLKRYRDTSASNRLSPLLETATEDDGRRGAENIIRGVIEVEGVGFQYPGASTSALKDVSIRIEPGEFVGLAGPSGSGKSTLIRLLLGFEHPSTGRILFDGRLLSDFALTEFRSQIDAVLQDETLVPGTVRTNIVGMSPYGQEEAWSAARAAQLAEDIEAMPMGMQTFASDDVLSTSQQQRLLIARAIVRRPKILILDEATSSLDDKTQSRILATLRHWNSAGAALTCLIVSHRPSLLAQLDRVFVFDHGRLVETRTPQHRRTLPEPATISNPHRAGNITPFRPEAVERLASPQPMDQLPRLIRPKPAWILLAIGIIAAGTAVVVWLFGG